MGRKILMALGAVAALAGAASPGGAHARELAHWSVGDDWRRYVLTGTRVVGPVLAGDRVVWARGDHTRSWTIESSPGGVVARLGVQGRGGTYHDLALAGSPTRLAYLEQFLDPGDRYWPTRLASGRVAVGAVGEEPRTVTACHTTIEWPGPEDRIALAGDVVAYDDPCGADVVHGADLAGGATWSVPGASSFGTWAAGATVALGDQLLDAATGARRAAYPPLEPGASVVDGAVQDDGVEALVVHGPAPHAYPLTVRVRTPGAAAARVVPLARPLVGAYGGGRLDAPSVRVAGGRIAARVRGPEGTEQLAVGGLDGPLTPVVDFGPETAMRPVATPVWWSFDGTRIAWASQQCERVTIGVTAVRGGAAAEVVPRKVCARPRVISESARVDAHGRFALRVACGAPCRDVLHLDYGGDPIRHNFVRFALPGSTRPQLVHARLPRGATTRHGVTVRVDGDPFVAPVTRLVILRRGRASTPRTP